MHYSSEQLGRLFRQHLRQSPAAYVRERRIVAVATHLVTTDASLEQISERCGFANRNHLTRVFIKLMGVAPISYRKIRASGPKS
jgi:transcriptional regulator GlxA family with amidase domain